jgi:dihydroorotate dehydrogenase (fumarate)
MANLSVKYMGLDLKSPIIVGSCGLTNSVKNIVEMAQKGSGAVVLKSIFEEQIRIEADTLLKSETEEAKAWNMAYNQILDKTPHAYHEAEQYITNFAKEHTLSDYLKFISEVKKAVTIPVIASINCVSHYDWAFFARRIQNAGADAIELNVYSLPSDFQKVGINYEYEIIEIIKEVKKFVTIPIALKIGYYYSGLANTIQKLSETGIQAIVLFNKPYHADIDIEKISITASPVETGESDYLNTLRWIALTSGKISCDLAATTGIFNSEIAIKQLLAGANACQVVSAIYKRGADVISEMTAGISSWMEKQQFNSIEEFRGKLSRKDILDPSAFERVQFMRHYSKID